MQAHSALADEDPTMWLDNGRQIEETLTQQNNVKVEYGASPDLKFGCTLTVDLQRRILEVIDFDEKKGPTSPLKSIGGTNGKAFSAAASRMGGSSYYPALNQSSPGTGQDLVLPDGLSICVKICSLRRSRA